MSGPQLGLAVSVFGACTVEAVEALTIVLAVGVTRSWRSAFTGVGVALLVLAALTAAVGPALTRLPIDALRIVIGGLLLVFGLRWLRKAVLRASGLKALHDEAATFTAESDAARTAGTVETRRIDPYAFSVAFKGTLLEGVEVVFIVVTFGSNQHDVALASAAAGLAVLMVVLAGLAIRAPLSRVPENTLKFGVAVMLTSFGLFWVGEGVHLHWPGHDASLLAIIPAALLLSMLAVMGLRRRPALAALLRAPVPAAAHPPA